MSFNLRGGRPKNRRQGIYWVQRHQAGQQATARTEATAQRQAAIRLEKVRGRLSRLVQILENVTQYVNGQEAINLDAKGKRKIGSAQMRWEDARISAMSEDNDVSAASINKLMNAGKSLIIIISGFTGVDTKWNKKTNQLQVDGSILDFS